MGRSYSGTIDFQFDIERWSHPSVNELLTSKQMKDNNLHENDCEIHVIPLYVTGWVSFTEGFTSGLPENCYPDESDSDIDSITDDDGNDWINKLSSTEMSEVWKKLEEKASNIEMGDSYDYDDYSGYDDDHYHRYDDSDYNY
jgi:hypothetical protein